jgi:parvulin-like peptidyl-prolyl cis-trans isomerase-like protein
LNLRTFPILATAFFIGAGISAAQTGAGNANNNSATTSEHQSAPAPAAPSLSAGPGQSAAAQPQAAVPPSAPVITINGVCEVTTNGVVKNASAGTAKAGAVRSKAPSAASTPDCKTQITRAEFEKLFKTVTPPGTPETARRQVAARYVQFLTAANEGVKLGVDKDPEFSEQLALMRLQLLAQDAERKLRAQASDVSEADAKAYYEQNPSAFEEVTLTRVFVPNTTTDAAKGEQPIDSKAIADKARQQLVAGDDPDKVQKSVFEQLKNSNTPPSTKFGAKRRGSLPPAQEQKIFALKQGEVSEVIPDSIGFVIYRADTKQQLPFEQAKDEVKRKLTQQRLEDARQQISGASKADYNDAYFGPETAIPKPGSLGSPPPSQRPGQSAPGASSQSGTPNQPPPNPSNPK